MPVTNAATDLTIVEYLENRRKLLAKILKKGDPLWLFNTAYDNIALRIRNLTALRARYKDERKDFLDELEDLYNEIKGLLDSVPIYPTLWNIYSMNSLYVGLWDDLCRL